MTNQVIPEEAVERGARVLIEDGKWGVPWEDASEEDRAETKDRVRTILEAAAPHMLAEAWDEGFHDGLRQDAEGDDGPKFDNPYGAAK